MPVTHLTFIAPKYACDPHHIHPTLPLPRHRYPHLHTFRYVLWWLYSKPGTTLGQVQVGLADTPAGPYTIANHNVTLKYRSFTSNNIFVDRPPVRLGSEGESKAGAGADTASESA